MNCWDITVTAVFSRLYGQISEDSIEEEIRMKESEEWNWFRTGKSSMDNI